MAKQINKVTKQSKIYNHSEEHPQRPDMGTERGEDRLRQKVFHRKAKEAELWSPRVMSGMATTYTLLGDRG